VSCDIVFCFSKSIRLHVYRRQTHAPHVKSIRLQ
jgi:hypothetical protein